MGPHDVLVATYTSTIRSAHREVTIFPLYIPTVFWLSSVLGLQILKTAYCFIFFISIVSQFLCLILSDRQGSGTRKDRQSQRRLKLLPQLSHKVGALLLFLPLSNSERLRLSQHIKIKWWGHNWCLYSSSSIISQIIARKDSAVLLFRQLFLLHVHKEGKSQHHPGVCAAYCGIYTQWF